MRKTKTTELFINEARYIHGNKYDYSKVNYVHSKLKITIICPVHGEFEQIPYNHLRGYGCKKCGTINGTKLKQKSLNQFLEEAKQIHGTKYDYSKVEYINAYTKVCIICPEHGEFWQTPDAHLNKKEGCPICCKSRLSKSKGEEFIENWLKQQQIDYIYNYEIKLPFIVNKTNIILADFYIPSKNIIIEYNGRLHYMPIEYFGGKITYENLVKRDHILDKYCNENLIKLITIKYTLKDLEIIKCLENYLLVS